MWPTAWKSSAALVAEAAQPVRRRRPTRPTRGSVQRRLQTKRKQSESKQRRRTRRLLGVTLVSAPRSL